jgi:hypothetical protein
VAGGGGQVLRSGPLQLDALDDHNVAYPQLGAADADSWLTHRAVSGGKPSRGSQTAGADQVALASAGRW